MWLSEYNIEQFENNSLQIWMANNTHLSFFGGFYSPISHLEQN